MVKSGIGSERYRQRGPRAPMVGLATTARGLPWALAMGILLALSTQSLAGVYELTAVGTLGLSTNPDFGVPGETVTVVVRYETTGITGECVNTGETAYGHYTPANSSVVATGSVSGNLPLDEYLSFKAFECQDRPDSLQIQIGTFQNTISFYNDDGSQFSRPISDQFDEVHDIFFSSANTDGVWRPQSFVYLTPIGNSGLASLDMVGWSIAAVPEPASLGLLALGGLAVVLRRRSPVK